MNLFGFSRANAGNKLPWLMMVGNPRAYRDCEPSLPVICRLYGDGNETRLFEQKRFESLHEAIKNPALQGDARAQYLMAYLYDCGLHVKQSDEQAFAWYMRAAKQGLREAENAVGVMYIYGQGVQCDQSEAMNWIASAARKGN